MRVIKLSPVAVLFTIACGQAADSNNPEKITVGFMLDGYYSWNRNHPAGRANQLHMFDVRSNQLSLSGARVSFERESDPVGYHLELGAGRMYPLMHSTEIAPRISHYLPQAYLSWKPDLRLDFVKFYVLLTHQGAFLVGMIASLNFKT